MARYNRSGSASSCVSTRCRGMKLFTLRGSGWYFQKCSFTRPPFPRASTGTGRRIKMSDVRACPGPSRESEGPAASRVLERQFPAATSATRAAAGPATRGRDDGQPLERRLGKPGTLVHRTRFLGNGSAKEARPSSSSHKPRGTCVNGKRLKNSSLHRGGTAEQGRTKSARTKPQTDRRTVISGNPRPAPKEAAPGGEGWLETDKPKAKLKRPTVKALPCSRREGRLDRGPA